MQIFNPYWSWFVDQLSDPTIWFFLVGPGFSLLAGTVVAVAYVVFWVMEAWDDHQIRRAIRANRESLSGLRS